ncbi:unnamed protein product [Eruca vesicaria subsp. sativa]|uniref:Uncharacterized protein n=1 Tax=Eruca vesicaria subsp. sativa TaxID=29727 RepID=A0ABC8IYT7_ERUVS|nr:unnamed protein product [Eruca vesicaria subsp. sativa]
MDSSSSSPTRIIMRDAESSASQFLSGEQETTNHVAKTNNVESEQVIADDRAILLTFPGGYPVSKAELHAYFTRRFGDIIEAIDMGEGGRDDQAPHARMVLHSAAKVPEIVSDGVCRSEFIINGKQVSARRFNHKASN